MYSVVSLFGDRFWERDFILNELLPEGYTFKVQESSEQVEHADKLVIIFSSSCTPFQRMKEICEHSNPIILIQLSDEFGIFPEYMDLTKHCKLYARHYHHKRYPNVDAVYIPLGYHYGMLNQKSTDIAHIPSSARPIGWSFVGEIRENRKLMISFFKKLQLGLPFCMKNGVSASDMFSIYAHSVFVPSERGHVSLDCFRIYEACIAGAIPVVVGNSTELSDTFLQEENPPWIFASNWRNAAMICAGMFKNKQQLDQKQQEIIQWWKSRVQKIQSQFLAVLQ